MDNPITYALSYIKRYIPPQVLDVTYMTGLDHRYRGPLSLDDRIRSKVLHGIVVVDCNLIGGTEVTVAMDSSTRENVDSFSAVYTIPKAATNNRSIVSVLSVNYGMNTPNQQLGTSPNGDFMSKAVAGLWWSNAPIPTTSTARATLIGENKVLVKDNIALPTSLYLRCWLENPDDYGHLAKPMYLSFAKLCLFAVQADIYTTMIVSMDQGVLQSGQELGALRSIIESYSDAQENYWTFYNEEWQGTVRAGDFESQTKLIKLALGGRY